MQPGRSLTSPQRRARLALAGVEIGAPALHPRAAGRNTAGSKPHAATACLAPFSSMYLDPQGNVYACCMNKVNRLGSITESSLSNIWLGPAATRLRSALGKNDFGLGCERCHSAIDGGDRDSAHLRVFDDLQPLGPEPEWPVQLEFAISNSCNLQCIMCDGDHSSSIRIHREGRPALPMVYGEHFFEELDQFLPHLQRVGFLGGEPFLAKETIRVVDRLVELGLRPSCHVTTNGSIWNERVERMVSALPMHVAVSVDGASAETFEYIRAGANHAEVVQNLERFRVATEINGGGLSLSVCLMLPNHHEFVEILHLADRLDIDVFVNMVWHPPQFSLHHLGGRELEDVLSTMRSQASRAAQLDRNRNVWLEAMASLEALGVQRGPGTAVAVSPLGSDVPSRLEAARAAASADSEAVMAVTTYPGVEIEAIGPDLWGIGVENLAGQPLQSLLDALVGRFGDPIGSEVQCLDNGVERRSMVFEGPPRVVATTTMTTGVEGRTHWFISLQDGGRS